jgi:hypothetical protein
VSPARALTGGLSILLLAAGVAPEVSRYAAEHRLRQATTALAQIVARPAAPAETVRRLERVAGVAAAAAGLPGDWRPHQVAGAARLLAGQGEAALAHYRAALALGERPEVDLNIGRALAALGRDEAARAAGLRAAWIAPAVLAGLPPGSRAALGAELERLERELRAGRLAAPPPAPR